MDFLRKLFRSNDDEPPDEKTQQEIDKRLDQVLGLTPIEDQNNADDSARKEDSQ